MYMYVTDVFHHVIRGYYKTTIIYSTAYSFTVYMKDFPKVLML